MREQKVFYMKDIIQLLKICIIVVVVSGCGSDFSRYLPAQRRTVYEATRYFEKQSYGKYHFYVVRFADDDELEIVNMRHGIVLQFTGEEHLCSDLEECDKAYIFENNGSDIREQLRKVGYTDYNNLQITLHYSALHGTLCKNDLLLLVYRGSLNNGVIEEVFNNYCQEGYEYKYNPTL